jgi:hypothetical protein
MDLRIYKLCKLKKENKEIMLFLLGFGPTAFSLNAVNRILAYLDTLQSGGNAFGRWWWCVCVLGGGIRNEQFASAHNIDIIF